MEQITFRAGGLVYVDTQIFIYSVEMHDKYWSLLEDFWRKANSEEIKLVTSELTLAEVLVAPLRQKDTQLINAYNELLKSSQVDLVPVSEAILREAAALRASIPRLRMPDAIHASTANSYKCDMFLTNDMGFRQIPGLSLLLLDDELE